ILVFKNIKERLSMDSLFFFVFKSIIVKKEYLFDFINAYQFHKYSIYVSHCIYKIKNK
ncbi:MAG: hypothetical protein RLZZ546_1227, partial [Bacteroidota bacterium]